MVGGRLRNFLIVAVFSGVAAILSLIKFGGAASIALDSFPGYFVSGFFSPPLGSLVAAIGHLLSAAVGGFPFGIHVHVLIAVLQLVWAFIFGIIPRYFNNIWLFLVSAPLAIGLNAYVGPKIIGMAFPSLAPIVNSLIPVLLLASAINIGLATLSIAVIRRFRNI